MFTGGQSRAKIRPNIGGLDVNKIDVMGMEERTSALKCIHADLD